jgi:hypothetical protein
MTYVDPYLDELAKLASPAINRLSPRYLAGLGVTAATLLTGAKLANTLSTPPPMKRKAELLRLEKTAALRRPHGMNPVFNLRGRGKVSVSGPGLAALIQEAYRSRPNRLLRDKLRQE